MSDKIKQLQTKVKELNKQIKTESQKLFKEVSDEIFEKYPAVNSFSWTAFTPYFADGDECVFSVNSNEPDINNIDGYDIPENFAPAQEAISKLLQSIDSHVHKQIFGDHVKITVTRNNINITNYEHD